MSRESPSPEDKREASVGPVGFWKHAASGHQSYVVLLISMAPLVECMGSIDSPAHTQEDCVPVESDISTLKLFAQSLLEMAVLDVQFIKLPGWSSTICAASYFFIKSHTA
eukprot:1150071-Pelagomonas_calceolata.AAC.2